MHFAGGSIFPFDANFDPIKPDANSPGDVPNPGASNNTDEETIDLTQKDLTKKFAWLTAVKDGPTTLQFREEIGYPIYLAAYNLLEEIEPIIKLKAIFNVLNDFHMEHGSYCAGLLDWELVQFLKTAEYLNTEARNIAETVYKFNPVSHESDLYRRHDIDSVEEATSKIRHQLAVHPDALDHILSDLVSTADRITDYLPTRGPAIQRKIEELIAALEADFAIIKLAHPKGSDVNENSHVGTLIVLAKTLLEPEHLPEILYLCRQAHHPQLALPAPQSTGIHQLGV